jgi:uncharacterized membrane protein YjjB (DUF3815 family)
MNWIDISTTCPWFGFAALGFAVLFNAPPRTLFIIWLLAVAGGFVKLLMLGLGLGPVMASLLGASTIGILSIPAAHNKHAPPMVFSIAAVIPMVPGVFAYRTMIGLVQLTGEVDNAYQQALSETINNGVKAAFILMALAVGVALPNIVMRKESAKEMKLGKRKSAC